MGIEEKILLLTSEFEKLKKVENISTQVHSGNIEIAEQYLFSLLT
jgi:hypothetical protein